MGNTESSAAPTEATAATAATEATEAAAAAPSGWTVQTKQLTGVSESSAGSEAPPTYSVTVPAHVSKMPLAEAICAALPELFPSTSAAKRACRRKGGPFTVHLAGGAEGRCSTTVRWLSLRELTLAPTLALALTLTLALARWRRATSSKSYRARAAVGRPRSSSLTLAH